MLGQHVFRKIDRRIYLVFLIVIAIALINALISTLTIRHSQKITGEIVNNTNPSLEALAKMNLLVTRSRMLITNWVYLPNSQADKDSMRSLNDQDYIHLRGRIQGLMMHWQNTEQIAAMNDILHEYEILIAHQTEIMRTLTKYSDYQDPAKRMAVEDILEREIIPRSESITERLQNIINHQTKTALHKQDEMLYSFNSLMVLVLGIAVLIICSILLSAWVISKTIIIPILQVRNAILQMGKGELPELNVAAPNNAVGEMFQALGFMIGGFRQTSRFAEEIGKGNFDFPFEPLSAKDVQGHALITMRNRLRAASEEEAERTYISQGVARLNEIIRSSSEDFNILLDKTIEMIVSHLEVQQAAVFLLHNEDLNDLHIQLGSYYALNKRILNSKRYELREGLIGQAVANNKSIVLNEVTDPFFTIDTGMGESRACSLMIIPLTTSGKVVGAIQVASLHRITENQQKMLEMMAEPLAASIFSVRANLITSQLLDESRKQADELAFQEQELRKINNELTRKSQRLQQSEEELKIQQDELRQVNIQLSDKAKLLEDKNTALEDTRRTLAFKAQQLEQSNRYKSAFLANMSHELRTPLNSILILAKILSDNKTKNLNQKQTEHARIIYKSGEDLLNLINDILDLSKIEAGKIDLEFEEFDLKVLLEDTHMLFRELATEKNIDFQVVFPASAELNMESDRMRISQVIKNLLSNAFKFTPSAGKVMLIAQPAGHDIVFKSKTLLQSKKVIALKVSDTGIGIAPDKQKLVFDAFQQADGSTTRKFGGTGLGLAISKELIHMLGGEIILHSAEGEGSEFTVYLPAYREIKETQHQQQPGSQQLSYRHDEILDDRDQLLHHEQPVLIIDDDHTFAKSLMNHCHRYDLKCVIALQGEQGYLYAEQYNPRAIILDLRMPVMDGWTMLKELKQHPKLNMIPVHIFSSVDHNSLGIDLGAETYTRKPDDNEEIGNYIDRIFGEGAVTKKNYLYYGTREEEMEQVLAKIREREADIQIIRAKDEQSIPEEHIDCVLVGSDVNAADVKRMTTGRFAQVPVIIFEGDASEMLSKAEELLNKTDNDENQSADTGNKKIRKVHNRMDEMLKGKVVLLADDDIRNIYSITSILEADGMEVISASDGREALEHLDNNPAIDIVLMDIMMPEMNGYEAMTKIREDKRWDKLPVIAVTAKAMQGDRQKCMDAGASDYITKPVNAEQLISVMKVWLYK